MNPANYQNMAGLAPGFQGNQQPGPQQNNVKVQQQIYRMLQQQPTPPGWQAAVSLQKRTRVIFELVSSLRLIKPDMDILQTINVAVTFEQKTCMDNPDEMSYDIACRQKLKDITDTRQRNAQNAQQQFQNAQRAQMNMTSQQMQMQGMVQNANQGQLHSGFQDPQMQQTMRQVIQPSSVHMQHQMSQQPQMMNPQTSSQPAQNPHYPPSQIPQQNGQASYTIEEQQQISRMAQILAQNTSPEQMELLQNRLRNVSPEIRQDLAKRNTNPLTHWFHNQATVRYAAQKAQHAAQRNQVNGALGNGIVHQQPRPVLQNPVSQTAGTAFPQNFDSSQILVQQQNALRSQEAGQMVVPGNPQPNAEQQRGTVRENAQQANEQINGVRQIQNPQQSFYPSQSSAPKVPNVSMQPQPGNFGDMPSQVAQHNLQGQLNGLNTPGRTPQQNPNMPNLNSALGSPNQQAQAAHMWPQQRPQPNQLKDPNLLNPQQVTQASGQPERPDTGQQRPRPAMFNMPSAMQQQLAGMAPEQRSQVLSQLTRQRQQQMVHQRAMQQGNAVGQGLPDSTIQQGQLGKPGPQFAVQNGQMMPGQLPNVQNGNGLQQPSMGQLPMGQQSMPMQRPQQLQQPNMNLINQQRAAQTAGSALTDEQARLMDRQNFPAGILNISGALSTLPKEVKTWGQLKGWVAQNQGTLPQGSLIKLRGLQGLHYQNLASQQKNKGRHMAPNTPGQPQVQGNPQPRAQTAQMIPSPNNQPPLTGSDTPGIATPNMAHPLPQPTPQEIQAAKARLPDHLKSMTDDQIRVSILRQRHNDMLKVQQVQPGVIPQPQAQFDQSQKFHQQQHQHIQFQTPVNPKTRPVPQSVNQRQQPQPSPTPSGPSKDLVGKQPQVARVGPTVSKPGQPNQKGTKRNSNDDVIEVPNPNLPTPTTAAQSSSTTQAISQPKPPAIQTPEAQRQKIQLEPQRQKAPLQVAGLAPIQHHRPDIKPGGQADAGAQRTQEQARKESQLQRIYMEVAQKTPRGNPVNINPQSRARMLQILGDTTKIMSRIPGALHIFFGLMSDEQAFRDLIRTHLLVGHQYRDMKYEQPGDYFTLSLEQLDAAAKKLSKYFAWLLACIQARKANQSIQAPAKPQHQILTQQAPPQLPRETMPALNAANLQQQQLALQNARAADLQRSHSNNSIAMQKNPSSNSIRTPAAPTSTQPPFSFGGQPPHGVPRAYGDRPNELTQDRLQIPSAKRRKGNQVPSAGSTPVLAQGKSAAKSSPRVMKNEATEVQQTPSEPVILRCLDPDCAMSAEEFATQTDLDAHQNQIHPNFLDPLEFCLESMRMGLNLDENGKSKERPEAVQEHAGRSFEATQMNKSTSTQGQAPIKQEGNTPMARAPMQTGTSPTPKLVKEPQSVIAKSVPKNGKSDDSKASQAAPKTPAPASEDPWANSSIPASVITSAFSGLTDLQSLGPWTKIQHTLTPDSTLSSGNTEKNSPRPSDISENDAVDISIDVNDNSWMPSEWFADGMGGIEALNMDQELKGMDWSFDDAAAIETGKTDRRKEKRDEFAPSKEWLKTWAPDKL